MSETKVLRQLKIQQFSIARKKNENKIIYKTREKRVILYKSPALFTAVGYTDGIKRGYFRNYR